ncbi:MAG: DUF975 family protein [Lachnospiraceae bacterium]|jgi:uncharacterized membrane protein|nr:DUF975 family protein [Lachnospiraceae bacterium]
MGCTSAELKRISRGQLTGHWGLAIGASLLSSLLVSAVLMPFYFLMAASRGSVVQSAAFFVAAFLVGMVSAVLECGVLRMHLAFSRQQEADLKMLFGEFARRPERYILSYLMVLGAAILCMLPGSVCILVGVEGGAVLAGGIGLFLYFAGIAVLAALALRYSLAFLFLVEDSQMGVLEAFRESAHCMEGKKGRLLYICLSFFGMVLLGMLSCGIGMLWVTPYMNQVTVNFYQDVAGDGLSGHWQAV